MTDAQLLAQLVELEFVLMTGGGQAEALLHPQAQEVGRSGRCYDRAALLHLLLDAPPRSAADISALALQRLSEDIALLRYRSQRGEQATERCSLWQRHQGTWRLRYHQGTPA